MIDVLESLVGLDLDGDGDRGDKTIPPIDPQNQAHINATHSQKPVNSDFFKVNVPGR
jgi:hypothetical protein